MSNQQPFGSHGRIELPDAVDFGDDILKLETAPHRGWLMFPILSLASFAGKTHE